MIRIFSRSSNGQLSLKFTGNKKRAMFSGDYKMVLIPAGNVFMSGELIIPDMARTAVIFSHGGESSRFSSRNRKIAEHLQQKGIATLLMDLLTEEEYNVTENRYNIPLLSERLKAAVKWLYEKTALSIGIFGDSTGAASAIETGAHLPCVKAIVSCYGRINLPAENISLLKTPSLLIVDSADQEIILLNTQAFTAMICEKSLETVEGPIHSYKEEDAIDHICMLTQAWFEKYL